MTEFKVEVVRVGQLEKHPNADSLSITRVHGGYPVIVRTEDWKTGDLGVYVPVDALVPTDAPEFAFLGTSNRIKAKRLRGVFSMGLLVPARPYMQEGEDVQNLLGVEKYIPPSEREQPERLPQAQRTKVVRMKERVTLGYGAASLAVVIATCAGAWSVIPGLVILVLLYGLQLLGQVAVNRRFYKPQVPYYDLDGIRKNTGLFTADDEVVVTEKIHGCNARYVVSQGKFFIGSRTMWGREDGVWSEAATKYSLESTLRGYPDLVLFGEVYGPKCQDLAYDIGPKDVGFKAFDLYDIRKRAFLSYDDFKFWCVMNCVPFVPELYRGKYDAELVARLAEGPSTICFTTQCREGLVCRTLTGPRKILKLAGEGYLTRKEAA